MDMIGDTILKIVRFRYHECIFLEFCRQNIASIGIALRFAFNLKSLPSSQFNRPKLIETLFKILTQIPLNTTQTSQF